MPLLFLLYLCLCVSHDTERKTKLKGGAAATGTVHGGGLCETESILALNLSGCPPLELHETVCGFQARTNFLRLTNGEPMYLSCCTETM